MPRQARRWRRTVPAVTAKRASAAIRRGRTLAGQKAGYLVNVLKAFRGGLRKDPMMAGVVRGLSDADITNLAAFYAAQSCQPAQEGKGTTMTTDTKPILDARRMFLGKLGVAAATCAGAGAGALAALTPADVAAASTAAGESFPTKDYDWTQAPVGVRRRRHQMHRLPALRRGLQDGEQRSRQRAPVPHLGGALCLPRGRDQARIDSHQDPVNIAASGSENKYRFANRYKDAKVEKAFFVPKLCNQCEHPACVQVCPVGATFQTKDGVVLIDEKHCIGCRYCVQACPYGARYFNEARGVPDKCNWCYHRITKGLQPACVEACPVGARVFGDTKDKQSPINLFIRNNRVQVLRPEIGQCAERVLRRHRQGGQLVEAHTIFAQYTGWVFPNETIIDWTILIAIYPYLTGLVAGAFTVSSLYQVFGFERLKPVAHLALLTSLCLHAVRADAAAAAPRPSRACDERVDHAALELGDGDVRLFRDVLHRAADARNLVRLPTVHRRAGAEAQRPARQGLQGA